MARGRGVRSAHERGPGAREHLPSAGRCGSDRRGEIIDAAPEIVLPHLADDGAADEADEDDLAQRNAERHAFLLTLGVWEVIPVEAFESRETRNRERFPWPGPLHDARMERIAAAGGWRFVHDQWSGSDHQNVWIAEDFRFRWSLTEAASRDSAKRPGCSRSGRRSTRD